LRHAGLTVNGDVTLGGERWREKRLGDRPPLL
jgi:hypothetical protein